MYKRCTYFNLLSINSILIVRNYGISIENEFNKIKFYNVKFTM